MKNKLRVLVVGPVCNISGYSEHARTLIDSLIKDDNNIDLYLQDTQWAASTRSLKYFEKYKHLIQKTSNLFEMRKDEQGRVNIAGLFDATFQVRPPNEFQKMSENDIGVTAALETTSAPAEWVSKCNLMSHILVVSEHAKKNLKNTKDQNGVSITTPVTVVPFGYNDEIKKVNLYDSMEITTQFNFLTVLQMAPRKNFENMLRWFVEEFKEEEKVGLVIKTQLHNNSTLDFYSTRARIKHLLDSVSQDRKCKVYFVHGNLTEQEMYSLYDPEHIDCYMTATHGEGFGIPIFNAACSGIPVVATNWSGHLDYLRAPVTNRAGKSKIKSHFLKVNYDVAEVQDQHLMPGLITKGCEWAYPKEESFKKMLRFVYRHKQETLKDAENLSTYLKGKYSLTEVHQMYIDFLNKELLSPKEENNDDGSTFYL
jgi:glycosyltransferase involved in cell wall biosynthesis